MSDREREKESEKRARERERERKREMVYENLADEKINTTIFNIMNAA